MLKYIVTGTYISFVILLLFVSCDRESERSLVVLKINEICSIGDPDWMEIYNPNDEDVDISGFFIYDSGTTGERYQLPEGTNIASNNFLVLLCDDQGTGLHTNFKLSSNGEMVTLEDNQGGLIDEVVFPSLEQGTSYGRNPDGSDNWEVFDAPTKGSSNTGSPMNTPPVISSVDRSPQFPTPVDSVTIVSTVIDDYGLDSVIMFYDTIGSTFDEVMMLSIGLNQFKAIIPPTSDSTTVRYYLKATDDSSAVAYHPVDAPMNTLLYISLTSAYSPPLLYINEFLASNDETSQDPDFSDYSDWIEIYNGEPTETDLSGMYLTDDLSDPRQWRIPDGTTIQPGSFLLFWADDKDTTLISYHTNFKLKGGGEQIGLFCAYMFNNVVVDTLTYSDQEADNSLGRLPDGSDDWQYFADPTPGSSNGP